MNAREAEVEVESSSGYEGATNTVARKAELIGSVALGSAALTPAGAAALIATLLSQVVTLREQRLRLKLELQARKTALEGHLRELEIRRNANKTYLDAQCRDRSDARQVIVRFAKDLIGVAEQVIRASCEATEPDGVELYSVAKETIAAAVTVIREKFPVGTLAVVADPE